jgi:hypothetical protein
MGAQARTGVEVQLDPDSDVALVRSSAPFAMNGSTTDFQTG